MRTLGPLLALLIGTSGIATATPFDMSSERDASKSLTDQSQPKVPETKQETKAAPQQEIRYVMPFERASLEGEIAAKTWTIYLTPGQAVAARKFTYGYRNAILVAPETSRLSVYVNDTLLSEEPVQSPGGVSERSFDLPEKLLRPGANKISFRAVQQHRTDCTIESTYELWSEIMADRTFLTLGPQVPQAASLDDVRAVGVDKAGRTRFKIVTPRQQQLRTDDLLRLTQSLALLARMPNQSFTVSATLGAASGAGEMTVVVGTAADLLPLLPGLPEAAKTAAFAGFVDNARVGQPVLVLSGPTLQSVGAAIETVAQPLDRPENIQRDELWTQAWTGSDTPLVRSRTSLTFARLGISTTEFSGRRFKAGFDIGVPADFYANAYGEAQILLDAAYSDEIEPGSHVDVYVNGNIATTVPITSGSGGIFRHLPIRVTMRHFRPGANRITIEANLRAKSDVACVPGATSSANPRFAIFDTSEFRMPNFARIGQLPNLGAAAGTGFPYGADRKGIALFLGRADDQTLSTTATFLGKLAVAAGRPLKTVAETSTVRIGDSNAIFVGAISQIPPLALERSHIADASRTAWGNLSADVTNGSNSQAAFDEWRSRVRGGSWQGQITALEVWLKETFDLSLGTLQLLPREDADTLPPNASTFMVAQGLSPGRTGTWTILSAPNMSELQLGMLEMSDNLAWQKLSGRLVLLARNKGSIKAFPPSQVFLVETQPVSLANYRLIAANWLSSNVLTYAALFALLSILLGITTSGLLNMFGRRK